MKNLIQAYLSNKKITIPVTIVAAALLVGGITFGVIESSKKVDTPSVSASKDAEKKEDVASKKKAEKKETASKDDKKESDIKELPEAKDNTKDTKQTTTAKNDTKKNDTKKSDTGSNKTNGADSGKTTNGNTPAASSTGNNQSNTSAAQKSELATCAKCGLLYSVGKPHDCPADYATDYYGNKVRKDSRYVVAVGGWGTKKYSDGTYEVTEEGRNANRQAYEEEKVIAGENWANYSHLQSLDAFVIDCSGI